MIVPVPGTGEEVSRSQTRGPVLPLPSTNTRQPVAMGQVGRGTLGKAGGQVEDPR